MMSELRVDRNQVTLRDQALVKMRNAILDFHFKPGERLVERDLCEQLGVSRSIVREVLCHLEAEGLIATGNQRGPSVAQPTASEAQQIYEIRALLEPMAARACAKNADSEVAKSLYLQLDAISRGYADQNLQKVLAETNEFYIVLFKGARRDVAWAVVRSLNARINQLRAMTVATPGRASAGVSLMTHIVDAIARGDEDGAHRACVAHISEASAIALNVLASLSKA